MTTREFDLNGRPVSCQAGENTRLLWVLRESLGDASARFGCGEGYCGSCMVQIDGRAMHACDVPLWAVHGKGVMTAAGLPATPIGRELLASFEALQAAQCGYCIAGVLMSAHALLCAEPLPDRARIAAALSRNLCRCGTHVRILAAIELAARRLATPGATTAVDPTLDSDTAAGERA